MNPTRKRRLWILLAIVLAAGLATALVALALQRNVAYLYTPREVLSGEAGARDAGRLRLEGKEYRVQEGDVLHFRFNV